MNPGVLTVVGVGFLVGFRHAFEPDHLAAVTTLATRERGIGHAARLGVAWGIGHTASVLAVALVLIVLGVRVPPTFYRSAELAVAALLIALGVSTLWREAMRHRRGLGRTHEHAHAHGAPHDHPATIRTVHRSFVFGVAHGLAGSGAVIVLLVAAAATIRAQFGYLLAFGLGTIVGMSIVSGLTGALTGALSGRTAERGAFWALRIRLGAALASAVVGVMLGWSVVSA